MQQISQNWNSMQPDMRKKYEELAQQDLERYKRDKVLFVQEFIKLKEGAEEDNVQNTESSDDERNAVKSRRTAKRKGRGQQQKESASDPCNKVEESATSGTLGNKRVKV